MDTIFQILCGIAAVILALYYYFTSTFDYWKSRGVRGPRPIPGFGNLKDIVLGKITVGDYITKLYHEYKDEQMIGIFLSRTPVLILKEPDLLKDIIIKDFPAFSDRGHTVHEKAEPLSQNLFHLNPKRWRSMRMKMTPMFTSRKLKEMFVLMSECANQFVNDVEILASKNEPIECLELTSKYTTDVIGDVAYGIQMNALSNEKSQEFRRIGRNAFHMPWSDYLRYRIKVYWPWLFDILGYILPDTEITTFFIRLVVDTIAYRDKHNIVRNDFIDMLREIKKNWNTVGDIEYTDSLLAAQAFIFFIAGYETSSTTMTNAFYELALNQKIQNRLREEIDQEYLKHNNLTYENIKEMDYLDKVIRETLRKYPPAMFNMRRSTTSYTFNNTDITIPKGQLIWIPMFALHHDPCVYPKPDVFDPERFNKETVRNRHPMFFQSFGDGPRNCIGIRVGIYQTKIGVIKILRNFRIEPCEKTEVPYVRNEKTFVVTPKNGLYLRFIKINRA